MAAKHTTKSTIKNFLVEITIRIILVVTFILLRNVDPFTRIIAKEELWLYKYPPTESYVTSTYLWYIVIVIPSTFIVVEYRRKADIIELKEGFLSLSLSYMLTAPITQFLKIIVGRPRPDFFYRCFPDGLGTDLNNCTGDAQTVSDGRRSFPSGHSSCSFSSMVFLSLYLAGKLRVFNKGGRGSSWRLCACILPLVLAFGVAVSRTCDYHHHWQDVVVGGVLGSIISYVCYRQYFPSLYAPYSDVPYAIRSLAIENHYLESVI